MGGDLQDADGDLPAGRYHQGSLVTGFEQADGKVTVTIEGRGPLISDVLVAADGASSEVRRRLLPEVGRSYAGLFRMARNLDEADVARRLVSFFDDAFTFSEARGGGHILAYLIPGEGADPTPGNRRVNWVWYVRAGPDDLAGLLVDRDGYCHHASLPQGLAPALAVQALCARAKREVHPRMAELVEATPDPFIQTIVDVSVPRTLFARVMLLGDSAFVVRPVRQPRQRTMLRYSRRRFGMQDRRSTQACGPRRSDSWSSAAPWRNTAQQSATAGRSRRLRIDGMDQAFDARYPARRLLDLIGDKWTPIVLFCLSGGVKRFNEMQRNIPDISKKMLIQVLRSLEKGGLVERTIYPAVPPKTDYRLTEDCRKLHEPIAAPCLWARSTRTSSTPFRNVGDAVPATFDNLA